MEQTGKQFDIKEFVLRRKMDVGLLLVSIVFGIICDWSIIEIAFFAVFIWSIVGPIASRYLAVPALFFLSFTPVLLAIGREERAEEFAVYAYYFLVMAVIRGIIEVRSEKTENSQQRTMNGK